MADLDDRKALQLLELARNTIGNRLKGDGGKPAVPDDELYSKPAATFVTLKIKGQLRGCIGTLQPVDSLWESISNNALNAAFKDSRFSPLTRDEFDNVHIDISILSEPVDVDYTDGDELTTLLRPGVDGVILQYGNNGATFLPQVWEQLPTVEQFLNQLCRKAGLSSNCWRDMHPKISIYQVQSFSER